MKTCLKGRVFFKKIAVMETVPKEESLAAAPKEEMSLVNIVGQCKLLVCKIDPGGSLEGECSTSTREASSRR